MGGLDENSLNGELELNSFPNVENSFQIDFELNSFPYVPNSLKMDWLSKLLVTLPKKVLLLSWAMITAPLRMSQTSSAPAVFAQKHRDTAITWATRLMGSRVI